MDWLSIMLTDLSRDYSVNIRAEGISGWRATVKKNKGNAEYYGHGFTAKEALQQALYRVRALKQKHPDGREWHGCVDPLGHSFDEGVCTVPKCGMDLRLGNEKG